MVTSSVHPRGAIDGPFRGARTSACSAVHPTSAVVYLSGGCTCSHYVDFRIGKMFEKNTNVATFELYFQSSENL